MAPISSKAKYPKTCLIDVFVVVVCITGTSAQESVRISLENFKILLLTYKTKHGLAPPYLQDVLKIYYPART